MKLAIIDKDGTLVRPKPGNTFVQHPEDQELIPGVVEAVNKLVADGYKLAIASNQGGVAAGYKTLDEAIAEMQYCMTLLPQIEESYFCPNFKGDVCIDIWKHAATKEWISISRKANNFYLDFRKPNTGMLDLAIDSRGLSLNRQNIIMIGDRPEDQQAASNAGIAFIHTDEWLR